MSEGKRRGEERNPNEHERKLLRDSSSDDLGVDDETLEDVLESAENDVGGEESLGEGDSSVGAVGENEQERGRGQIRDASTREREDNVRVIKGSLEPLNRVGHERVLLENHEVSGERADSLGSHGVLRRKTREFSKATAREEIRRDLLACRPWQSWRGKE